MRVLITGGRGYVGGCVGSALAARAGFDVTYGTRETSRLSNADVPGVRLVEMRWHDDASLAAACKGRNAIVHLAGRNARECEGDPVAAILDNVANTARLVRAAAIAGIQRFIYVSTVHVYGAPSGYVTEESPLRGVHPYASSHKAAEDVVRYARLDGSLDGVIVRLSNAFGVPASPLSSPWALAVNDLCRQAAERGGLRLNTAGTQHRDFVPMCKVTDAIEILLGADLSRMGDPVFNLGSGMACSIRDMAAHIAHRCEIVLGHKPPVILPVAAETGAPFCLSIERLERLGYACQRHHVDAEIDRLLRYCSESLSTPNRGVGQ